LRTIPVTQSADATTIPRPRSVSGSVFSAYWFALGVTAIAVAVAVFFLLQLTAWPPHEDEALALFVGRDSFGDLVGHVTHDRGGAPLHFVLAWCVAHAGFGLAGLRLVSAALAVASIPVMALLGRRLADRRTALLGTAIAAASWVFLFHGVFGRMYSLLLLTTTLAALALLRALDSGRGRDWALWGVAILAAVGSHPYGALVLAGHGLFVLARRRRLRAAVIAFGAVLVAGTPFWLTDLVLARRFDVGVGGGGSQLGGPREIVNFFWLAAGDQTVGWGWPLAAVVVLAAVGALSLRGEAVALTGALVAVPAMAFLAAHLHSAAAPQTRHLIFLLPFFPLLVAAGIVRLTRSVPALGVVAVAALVTAEVGWAWHRTPALIEREGTQRVAARQEAGVWLAGSAHPDDVLFGYDPVFVEAWERNRSFSRTVVPRADAVLALRTLRRHGDLGHALFVLDGSDPHNRHPTLRIPLRLPEPANAFEVRRFGPFLVVRTREATHTPARFLRLAESVQRLGRELGLDDSVINLDVVLAAERRLR
jgi:Dolichyl-phosphate-mannose-protein mannosyltransferase